jgi:phospholipase/carboxylesterase
MTRTLTDIRSAGSRPDSVAPVALLLHGFGSSEHDLGGLAGAIGFTMPWASLRAPVAMGNGGAAWFEIITPGNPNAAPVAEATDAIWEWVDDNIDATVPIVPIGFSQGGLMASQLLRTRPERVAATVVLGGFVLGHPQPGDEALSLARPPVFWGRGANDRVIADSAISRTAAFLGAHSSLVERVYPGLAHGISGAELDDVRTFISTTVGPGVLIDR